MLAGQRTGAADRMTAERLLQVEGLVKRFPLPSVSFRPRAELLAVDHVSLFIHRGETLALVGESGSGTK